MEMIFQNDTSLPLTLDAERTALRSLVVALPWGRNGELGDASMASPAGRDVAIASHPGRAGASDGGRG